MQRTFTTILTFSLLLASSLNAQLNPFDWFAGDNEDSVALNVTRATQESEAAAMLEIGKAKAQSGKTASANRTFEKIIKKYPNAAATANAHFLRGQIFITKGKWVKAFKSFQSIIAKHLTFSMPQPTQSVIITGTGSYAPENVVTNDDMAKIVDTSDEWIRSRSGIRERRFALAGETTSDMAVAAAQKALDAAGAQACEIDLMILATSPKRHSSSERKK